MKTLCPICSDTLLRHLCRSRVSWFCLRCHQEMPNLNLIKFNSIQKKIRKSDRCLDNYENSKIKCPIDSVYQTIQYQSNIIDLFVDRNKKRLEVVGFIMNKIDLLLVNTFADLQTEEIETKTASSPSRSQKNTIATFIKAKFIRDSEFVLLRICQAILLSDGSIINNLITQELIITSANSKITIEKTYFIDLIKTLVIDFVKSITLDSSQNIDCFTSEISGYFEMVIRLMLSYDLETDII